MKYRRFVLTCQCGRKARHFAGVGLSTDHQIVVYWRCPWCRSRVYVVKPLADCWRECPAEEEGEEAGLEYSDSSASLGDLIFLHSLGVKYPDG